MNAKLAELSRENNKLKADRDLLDHFAYLALSRLMDAKAGQAYTADSFAGEAYLIARAMMKERSK